MSSPSIEIATAKKTFNDTCNYLSSLNLESISPQDLTRQVISPLAQLGTKLNTLQQTELPTWLKMSLGSLEKLVKDIVKDYEDLRDNTGKIENVVTQLEQENIQYRNRFTQIEQKIAENNKMIPKLKQIKASTEMINQPREQKDQSILEKTAEELKEDVNKTVTETIKKVSEVGDTVLKEMSEARDTLLKEVDKSSTELEQTFTSFFSSVFSKLPKKPINEEPSLAKNSEETLEKTPGKNDSTADDSTKPPTSVP